MTKNRLFTLLAVLAIVPTGAFAQTASTTSATTTTATSTQITCMQNALEKREMSLITTHDVYASSTKAALTNRMYSLKASWGESDRKVRISKREAAYKAFRMEMQAANNVLRTAKNSAWRTFQVDAKACGVKATGELPSNISGSNTSL
jgi:hypothetical protein